MDLYPAKNTAFWAGVEEYSQGAADYQFAGPEADARELRIRVIPRMGDPWVGGFRATEPGIKSMSAMIGTSAATGLILVTRGTGFLGDVLQPESFTVLPTREPITSWFRDNSSGLVLLATPWRVLAIDATEVCWISKRLAIEGLIIEGIEQKQILGTTDPTDDAERPFVLDITTGEELDSGRRYCGTEQD